MVKYKLIKNYPQFEMPLECHSIADGGYYTNKGDRVYNPEDYPEFWEKIIKKNYEVLSYKCFSRNLEYQQLFIKQNNLFCWSTVQHNESYILNNMWNNKTGGYVINSVERLSDNVVFSVGDNTNAGIIKQFNICGNTLQLKVDGLIFLNDYLVKKVKQPLFTTEDGIDIFEGDIYYHTKPDFTISYGGKADNKISGNLIGYKNYKYFSTKEKAQEWVVLNKPCLSIKEICPIIGQCNNTTYIDLDKLTEKLKELVKSKL